MTLIAFPINALLDEQQYPDNVRINLRGMVQGMNASFQSFAAGLALAVILLFLILVAPFRSFKDPFLIMLAIPMGFIGILIALPLTHTTLNVMSLMGVLMLVGIAASNSILIVEFAHRLEEQGRSVQDAIITWCRVRLRPILMTSLATIIGMMPMAFRMGTGSEQYTPLAIAIIGGLTVSVLLTVYIVPAAYLLVYGRSSEVGHQSSSVSMRTHRRMKRIVKNFLQLGIISLAALPMAAQNPRDASLPALPPLTLEQAKTIALQNHPQIAEAQNEVNFAGQQIAVNRAAYYPSVTADVTGSQGNNLSRIGAGDLPASCLFNRFGQGVRVEQVITDSGRTPNLVASSRLTAQASAQTAQATRYNILMAVTRAYFDVLRAQATVKVAEQTVAARQ